MNVSPTPANAVQHPSLQEIKAIKVQQKAQPRLVAELQSGAAAAAAATELAGLRQRMQSLESAVALTAGTQHMHAASSTQLANLTAQVRFRAEICMHLLLAMSQGSQSAMQPSKNRLELNIWG